MRLLLIIPLFFISCSASKEVGKWHEESLVIYDTIVIPAEHIHFPEENLCVYFDTSFYPTVDTVYIKYYIPKK
jgi:hypothetical protein